MRIISVAYKLKALHRIARQGRIWGEEMSRSNQEQRKILSFARRHGDAAASEAYEVSRWTLRRWRKLARTRGEAFLGDCRGGRSGRRSGRKADRRQVEFIRAFRADRLHMNAGKEAVKPALDAFSRECGLPPLSVSTIGRLIADAPDGMRASPRMDLDRRGRVKPRKRRRNHERRLPKRMSVRNPGDLVALDTVEIRPVGGGARLFLFTAVDHHSRLAFAMAFPKRNAQCAAEFLRRLLLVLPVPVLALLSDNGAEFQADFDRLADRLGLRRFFIFPSCPKQNGRNERFNRTLRYGFVQANEHFADDLPAFNRQLAAWLIWHNAQKPHRALAGNTPLNFLHSQLKNGQLLWTPTSTAINKCRDLFGDPPQFPTATGDPVEDAKHYVTHCNVEGTILGVIPATINLTGAKECSCDSASGYVGEYPNCACPTGGSANANGVCACASGSVVHGETCIPKSGDFGEELSEEILCEVFGGDVLQQSLPQEAENLTDELLTLVAFPGTSAETATVFSAMVDAIQAKWRGDTDAVNTFLSRYDTDGADHIQNIYRLIIIVANHDAYGVGTFDEDADNQLAEILARVPVDLSGKICSGMDANDTFCIIDSADAFPCRGLFKHLRSCNVDFNRKALNPFFCGARCAGQNAVGTKCR